MRRYTGEEILCKFGRSNGYTVFQRDKSQGRSQVDRTRLTIDSFSLAFLLRRRELKWEVLNESHKSLALFTGETVLVPREKAFSCLVYVRLSATDIDEEDLVLQQNTAVEVLLERD